MIGFITYLAGSGRQRHTPMAAPGSCDGSAQFDKIDRIGHHYSLSRTPEPR
jgi:hypothetical protein